MGNAKWIPRFSSRRPGQGVPAKAPGLAANAKGRPTHDDSRQKATGQRPRVAIESGARRIQDNLAMICRVGLATNLMSQVVTSKHASFAQSCLRASRLRDPQFEIRNPKF